MTAARSLHSPIAEILLALTLLSAAPLVRADEGTEWLDRAALAARKLNYTGTIVYQHGGRVETSRLVHMNDMGVETEKLVNLDGPAREVIRSHGEVRCFYPDARVVRIEPRTFRNAFPSLSPLQLKSLTEFYEFQKAETGRVAGMETQAYVFEPKDGLRYAHKFWAEIGTGLLLKARIINEKNEVVEQFTFTDVVLGARVDRDMVKPSWPPSPPDWTVVDTGPRDVDLTDTGWTVDKLPPGFVKSVEGFRALRGKRARVAHLVFSDGLAAVSVFVEPVGATARATGMLQQAGMNVYVRQFDDQIVTVLGEVPAATVRQIAYSVARR
ncbi:MAG: siderophore-interacting protein [Aromatoleum sp.]|nr:siderophore-interacting protein [Aromatoleum sp.]